MITAIKEIPTTSDSYCFASAVFQCDFEAKGWEEKEYYMHGTANVYRTGTDGKPYVYASDVPYVNRIVVRQPADPAKASGNVLVEIINASAAFDIERMWINGYGTMMREGDTFIGITSKPYCVKSLKFYDEKRYGCLSWPNPHPEEPLPFDPDKVGRSGGFAGNSVDQETETGLFWDMLTDLADLCHSHVPENPVHHEGKDVKVILSGWSQSSRYLRVYVNKIVNNMDRDPYDGYIAAGGGAPMPIPLTQYEFDMPVNPLDIRVHKCRVPFMALQTETDAYGGGAYLTKLPDSDEPGFPHRVYEFTGGSHDTSACLPDYYQADPKMVKFLKDFDAHLEYQGTHVQGNDYPYRFLFGAAYRNMFNWVRYGFAPARAERMVIDENGNFLRDGFGNTMGGVRTCLVNYPTAHYSAHDMVHKDGTPFTRNFGEGPNPGMGFGYEEPFSPSLLKELYGSLANYRKLCEEDTFRQVTRGFVCKEDAEELTAYAVSLAKARGLE